MDRELADYEFQERAAVFQFDLGLDRAEAEAQALKIMAERYRGGLRAYQWLGLANIEDAWSRGQRRVIFYLPTGGGKTRCAGELILRAQREGKRVAFVCNRIELVNQASQAFHHLGIHHGIVQGENTRTTGADVLVGSIQTVVRRGISDLDLVIVDEAHGVAASRAYHRMFAEWKNIPIVGLTATPFSRGLGKHHAFLGGNLFESIIVGATIPQLINGQFLVDADIYAPSEPDLSKVKIVAGDYQEDQLADATDRADLIGDIVSHWQRLAPGTQTLCFAVTIAHSKHIAEQFVAAGIKAEHVDAYTPEFERVRIIRDFREGKFQVLSNCAMLAEGFDVPAASTLILARPTKSLIRYIQMIGRVLRPFPGKTKALVLDHSGSAKRLGFPTDELPLKLHDGKPQTSDGNGEKKPEALPKPCPNCQYLKPPRVFVCPSCGHKPAPLIQVETVEGELEKMERGKKAAKKLNRELTWDEKVAWMGSLKTYAQAKGYKSGWAAMNYKEKFGVFPNDPRVNYAPPCAITPEVQRWITAKNIRWAKRRDATAA